MQTRGQFDPFAPPTTDVDSGVAPGEQQQLLADRGTRFVAQLLDGLLTLVVAAPGPIIGLTQLDPAALSSSNPFRAFSGFGSTALLISGPLVLGLLIYQWYLVATTGQSLAKKWMRVRIVRYEDGGPVGFVKGVVLRSWILMVVAWIPYVGGLIRIIDALVIFGEERRCMHDLIAGTKVVAA
jgi:uncharacterized RDD family membrane protein YckC